VPPSTRRRSLLRAALLLGTTCLAAAGAEAAWRLLAQRRYEHRCAAFAEPLFRLVDGDALYDLRPGADVEHTIADPAGGPATVVRYRVDPVGLRVHPSWPPPPAHERPRMLFLGDSYTFGTAVGDGESFPHCTEVALTAAGVPGFAIAAGVPGHNSEQELARLPALLATWTPKVVVLAFIVNDAEPPTYAPLPPAYVYRDTGSWLLADTAPLLHTATALVVDDRPFVWHHAPEYEYHYQRSWTPGHRKATAALAAIHHMQELCRTHGASFVVATVPDFTRTFDDTYPYAGIHAQVCRQVAADGGHAIDLLPPLRGADAAALRVPGDGHPNAAGHRRIGALLAPRLAEVLRG
jgi:lysophospholipase L1-like esterase